MPESDARSVTNYFTTVGREWGGGGGSYFFPPQLKWRILYTNLRFRWMTRGDNVSVRVMNTVSHCPL